MASMIGIGLILFGSFSLSILFLSIGWTNPREETKPAKPKYDIFDAEGNQLTDNVWCWTGSEREFLIVETYGLMHASATLEEFQECFAGTLVTADQQERINIKDAPDTYIYRYL